MANTVTIAAIKTALDGEVDDLNTLNTGTPTVKELEAGLARQVAALLAERSYDGAGEDSLMIDPVEHWWIDA